MQLVCGNSLLVEGFFIYKATLIWSDLRHEIVCKTHFP